MEFLQKEVGKYLIQREAFSLRSLSFSENRLLNFLLVVARGSCGLDRVCLPPEATTNSTGSPQWSRHSGVARCTVAIFKF
jgi:hypothetical protein